MYMIAHEPDEGGIRFYTGKEHGTVYFICGTNTASKALKYKTYSGAERAMNELRKRPGGKKARLFIMPEEVYEAYEEWDHRRAAKLRKELGIE